MDSAAIFHCVDRLRRGPLAGAAVSGLGWWSELVRTRMTADSYVEEAVSAIMSCAAAGDEPKARRAALKLTGTLAAVIKVCEEISKEV
jgi:hypothetical protein